MIVRQIQGVRKGLVIGLKTGHLQKKIPVSFEDGYKIAH